MADKIYHKISEIIKAEFKNSYVGGEVILQDSTSKVVKINKKGSFLCLQPDQKIKDWKNNFPFFETSITGSCSVSDHIIVYINENSLYIFIIELKSTNPTGAIKQVHAGFELGKYIVGTARRMLNYPIVDVKYRGLIFSSKTFKGTTKPKNLKYRKVINTELEYRHLQSGNSYNLDILCI